MTRLFGADGKQATGSAVAKLPNTVKGGGRPDVEDVVIIVVLVDTSENLVIEVVANWVVELDPGVTMTSST